MEAGEKKPASEKEQSGATRKRISSKQKDDSAEMQESLGNNAVTEMNEADKVSPKVRGARLKRKNAEDCAHVLQGSQSDSQTESHSFALGFCDSVSCVCGARHPLIDVDPGRVPASA